jgi:membrane protease subunit (stomatin/prohibitin family)
VPAPASTAFCPRCHQLTGAAARFCTSCGLPLVPAQQLPQQPPVQPTGSWSRCAACGALNQPQHRYCTRCGTSLLAGVAPLQCRRCGARNAAGTRFCTRCGAPFH